VKTARLLALFGILSAAGVGAGVYTWNAASWVAESEVAAQAEPEAQARLVRDFSGFAGSELNARSLVVGLREGKEIVVVARAARGPSVATTRFTSPTRSMDYSSLRVALALAREQLQQLGITRPTPGQIKAVLVGGGVAGSVGGQSSTPFLLPGVLQMRAAGMSWSKIAGTMGLTLAQTMNGPYVAGADAPADPAAKHAVQGAVTAAAATRGAPALRTAVIPAAPISAASITTSVAGGPTTRAEIRRETPTQIATREPAQKPRRSQIRTVVAADGAARKETATVRAPDSAQGEAVQTVATPASAAAPLVEPDPSANDQRVD
jgi:hypothetical protein